MSELLLFKVILAVTLTGAGAAQIWLAWATASGRLGRNQVAGIRTPATLASDEAWIAAHRASRSATTTSGWCAIATGLVGVTIPSFLLLAIEAFVGTTLALVIMVVGTRRGVRAARQVAESGAR